jgi:hypothetical protein
MQAPVTGHRCHTRVQQWLQNLANGYETTINCSTKIHEQNFNERNHTAGTKALGNKIFTKHKKLWNTYSSEAKYLINENFDIATRALMNP